MKDSRDYALIWFAVASWAIVLLYFTGTHGSKVKIDDNDREIERVGSDADDRWREHLKEYHSEEK